MSMIQVSHLTFCYEGGMEPVFEDVSFRIDTDWKLGFVGRNGRGKTTLLRDLIRRLSEGDNAHPALRIAVVDERGELGAVYHGMAQFDLGRRTDILTGIPKAEGISMLLRTMNPQVIAVDEITDFADIHAMSLAANCGVSFLATVHGRDLQEIKHRKVCRELLDASLFTRFAVLEKAKGERRCRVESC